MIDRSRAVLGGFGAGALSSNAWIVWFQNSTEFAEALGA